MPIPMQRGGGDEDSGAGGQGGGGHTPDAPHPVAPEPRGRAVGMGRRQSLDGGATGAAPAPSVTVGGAQTARVWTEA